MSNGMEFNYSMSANGEFISFLSDATNLMSGVRIPRCDPAVNLGQDTGGGTHCTQTYLWKSSNQHLTLVSVKTNGRPTTEHSAAVDVSADGRFVAFATGDAAVQSRYQNLSTAPNMFVRDMRTGKTSLECLSSRGVVGSRPCADLAAYTGHFMSADGRYLVFDSGSDNLSPQSPNSNSGDAYYVRDRRAGTTVRVDIANDGSPAGGGHPLSIGSAVMSADGRWVAFVSAAQDLSAQATQGHQEVYLHDMTTASTSLASVSGGGRAGNGDSFLPSLTSDGGVLAFESTADNLDGHDTTAGQCPADVGGNCSNVYLHQNIGVAA